MREKQTVMDGLWFGGKVGTREWGWGGGSGGGLLLVQRGGAGVWGEGNA